RHGRPEACRMAEPGGEGASLGVRRQCAAGRSRPAGIVDPKPERCRDGVLAAAGRDRSASGPHHLADRQEHMSARNVKGAPMRTAASYSASLQRGAGLIEIMIGILISMLMVLIIYQVYTV